jgi:hypothetical protein
MKDRKSLYLLIFALIVVMIAFTLISIWGYRFYFSKKVAQKVNALAEKKTNDARVYQTYQKPLDSALQQLNNPADTITYDSSDHELALKIMEFNRIKNEIALILKKRASAKDSASEIEVVNLQKTIDKLRNQNIEITKENARLNEMVKLLPESKQKEKQQRPASEKSKEQPASSLPLLVSHLRFGAYNNDQKTGVASKTKKLAGSFEINVKPQNTSAVIYVVIVQPNGKVLLNASGASATFQTISGRKVYSAAVHFDNERDNHKRLQFSVNSDTFYKGKYKMQIYHEGIIIGRLEKILY